MRPDRSSELQLAAGASLLTARGPRQACSVLAKGVRRTLGRTAALRGVELEVRPGEFVALLGPSGSGKTTLLRLIAGLDRPDEGGVFYDGVDVTAAPAAERKVGFVFQSYALFRHMTVGANVAFGLDVLPRSQRPPKADRRAAVAELLRLVGLEGFEPRRPASLSGGQRQRVALARALAPSPRLLLLDEPFGALDALVRKSLRRELRRIHDATGVTTIFVTHDQEEALELADRVAVLNEGLIEQYASPETLLDAPASAFVAGFIGQSVEVAGVVEAGVFRAEGARLEAPGVREGPARAFVRPDEVALAGPGEGAVDAVVLRAAPRGSMTHLEAGLRGGAVLEALIPRIALPAVTPGDSLRLALKGGRVFTAGG